ncbi:unnamed protein product [Blepharisma stoltei]|uniref:Histidine kinase n=1 Tax=Blepharisma stoltei TaxID=1481888 RepID=A0AAU9IIW1_9CILI|nr:unnamed protein product [Blepharisma stoltei]
MEILKNLWWEEEVNEKYQIIKKFTYIIMGIVIFFHAVDICMLTNIEILIEFIPYNLTQIAECIIIWQMENKNMNIKSAVAILISETNICIWYSMSTIEIQQMRTLLATLSFASVILCEWPFLESFWARNFLLIKSLVIFNWTELSKDFDFLVFSGLPLMVWFLIFLLAELSWQSMKEKSYGKFLYRKNIENAEQRIELILKLFPDGILIISQCKKILYSNENLIKFLNCDVNNVTNVISTIEYCKGKNYSNSNSNKLIDDIISINNLQINEEKLLGITEVNSYNLEWKGQKVLWNSQEAILLTLRNVNNIIQLEKSVSDNNFKTIILRTVSHELRTPINAISVLVESLKEEPEIKKNQEWSEKLSIAMISSRLLLSLINDLLDFSKILAGVFSIQKSTFSLRDAINSSVQLIKLQLEKKDLGLFVRIDPGLPAYICTDALRFNQVLLNLLSNALKFTLSGFIEIICLACPNGQLKVIVEDTGIGMKANKLKDLFREFSTHNKTLNPTGCGLGLFISNIIAQELGSNHIEAESKPNQGSSFSFSIDISEGNFPNDTFYDENICDNVDENYSLIKIKDFTTVISQSYPNILIVDDNEFNRIVLGSILTSNKISYHEACTGSQAVEYVKIMDNKRKPYKLVIMDGSMPELNGWEATKIIYELHSQGKIKNLPSIIGYSAFTSGQDVKVCIDAGMKECISKPCNSDELISKISRYLL